MTQYRWRIAALLFLATTINYFDRNLFSVVMIDPAFKSEFGFTKEDFSVIDACFKVAYGIGFLVMGSVLDVFGPRKGLSLSLSLWAACSLAHAFCGRLLHFSLARFGLGLGESGNFPGAVKASGEWFPKEERALALGIVNAGANVGVILVYSVIPFILREYGWRWVFVVSAVFQCLWLFLWFRTYRSPENCEGVNESELTHIRDGRVTSTQSVPWSAVTGKRQAWAFAASKFLCEPVWYFDLVWLPTFFSENEKFGGTKLDLKSITLPFLVIYIVSDLGSVAGGWFSSRLIKAGLSTNAARKSTMLLAAIAVLPVYLAAQTTSLWTAVGLIAIGTAAHQANSSTLFATVGDMFPSSAAGRVTGMGSFMGSVSGAAVAYGTGTIVAKFGFQAMFIYASVAYLLALIIFHVLVPRLEPAKLEE